MRITTENRDRNGHVLVWDQPGLEAFQKQQKPACKFIYYYQPTTHTCFTFHITKEMMDASTSWNRLAFVQAGRQTDR